MIQHIEGHDVERHIAELCRHQTVYAEDMPS